MDRMKAILAAGGLTGLVLAAILIFGWGNGSVSEASTVDTTPTIIVQPADTAATAVDSGQQAAEQAPGQDTQNLEAALQALQAREAQYRTQIEAANQTILQLQSQLTNQSAQSAPAGDDDRYEHEEHESEGHEHEEYEGYDD